MPAPRLLLLQIRDPHDPMLQQEAASFIEAIECSPEQLTTHDLLVSAPTEALLQEHDVVLIGGSGEYSVTSEGRWLDDSLEVFRWLYNKSKPTFASCWGFQAMSRALGGRVEHDPRHAELGTIELHLTDAGIKDPLFSELGTPFFGLAGHEDRVVELPPGAQRLASSNMVENQAYRFPDRPIYGTQFHPELSRKRFLERVVAYPQYIERITGIPYEEFVHQCTDAPKTYALMKRFLKLSGFA